MSARSGRIVRVERTPLPRPEFRQVRLITRDRGRRSARCADRTRCFSASRIVCRSPLGRPDVDALLERRRSAYDRRRCRCRTMRAAARSRGSARRRRRRSGSRRRRPRRGRVSSTARAVRRGGRPPSIDAGSQLARTIASAAVRQIADGMLAPQRQLVARRRRSSSRVANGLHQRRRACSTCARPHRQRREAHQHIERSCDR